MLSYQQVKDKPVVFRALTSLDRSEFEQLLVLFSQANRIYIEKNHIKGKNRTRRYGGGRRPKLAKTEDQLFFILFYFKTYPLQEVIAFLFGLSQGQVNEWIHRLSDILKLALDLAGQLPERDPDKLADFLAQYETLEFAIDGTERKRQRPVDQQQQNTFFSGKKRSHAVKNNIIVHPDSRKVCYLSRTVEGKKHDKKICDEEGYTFPAHSILLQDTGFQGFVPDKVIVLQPKKKPRGKELTATEKMLNRIISGARIIVENVIAGIKRCRVVKDIFRNTKVQFDDLVMEIACGLHNFRVEHRSPIQTVNLSDFYFQ